MDQVVVQEISIDEFTWTWWTEQPISILYDFVTMKRPFDQTHMYINTYVSDPVKFLINGAPGY